MFRKLTKPFSYWATRTTTAKARVDDACFVDLVMFSRLNLLLIIPLVAVGALFFFSNTASAEPGDALTQGYIVDGTSVLGTPILLNASGQRASQAEAGAYLASKHARDQMKQTDGDTDQFQCTAKGVGTDVTVGTIPRVSCVVAYIAFKIMTAAALLFGTAGVVLNYAVLYLVTGMGQFVLELGIGDPWRILRDIANVFLVFLTLFIGIATILGTSSYGYKSILWRVFLAALLVNFSLLFTQVIIDVANLAAHSLYTQLQTVGLETKKHSAAGQLCQGIDLSKTFGTSVNNADNPCLAYGIAGAFQSKMGLQGVYQGLGKQVAAVQLGASDDKKVQEALDNGYDRITLLSFLGTIMFIVGAFVFGAAALLLVSRFVILVFLMVLSAPAFVMFITGRGGGGSKWWNTLLKESFFAPALFLMIWVSFKMLENIVRFFGVNNGGTQSAAATGNIASIQLVFSFFIVCAFLIGSLIIARSLGAHGAATMVSVGNRWSRSAGLMMGAGAGAATAGVVAYGGRRTGGLAARLLADSETLKKQAFEGKTRAGRFFASSLRSGFENVAGRSFDARSVSKTAQKYVGTASGKGGYDAWAKKQAEAMKEQDKQAKEYRGTSEERRLRDEEMATVTEGFEQSQRIDVEKEVGTNLGILDTSIKTLTKTIEEEKKKGASKEVLDSLDKELLLQKKKLSDFTILGQDMKRQKELRQALQDETLSAPQRAAHEQELATLNKDVREGYAYIDPKLSQVQVNITRKQEELNTAKTDAQRKVAEKELRDLQSRYATIANYHDMRRDIQSSDPSLDEAGIRDLMNKARIAERNNIEARVATEYKKKGEARAAAYIDRESTRTNDGITVPDWRRRAVAQIRATKGKTKEQSAFETVTEMIEKAKKASTPSTEEAPSTPSAPTS